MLARAGLRANLYPHQREGVSWMLRCELRGSASGCDGGVERESDLPPLWQRSESSGKQSVAADGGGREGGGGGGAMFCDVITNVSRREPPPAVLGGLVADAMGLGKTIQVCALPVTRWYGRV
jgi:SNF2 family DNA or RNA helicase